MRPDPKGRSFAFAVVLHGSLLGGVFVASMMLNATAANDSGEKNAGGASSRRGSRGQDSSAAYRPPESSWRTIPNRSAAGARQAARPQEKEVTPPDAVKINLHKDKKPTAKEESVKRHFRPFDQLESNQLASKTPQAVSSPLFSQMPGSGRVGMGANTTLGTQFGAYAAQIQDLIAQELADQRRDGAGRAPGGRVVRLDEGRKHSQFDHRAEQRDSFAGLFGAQGN